MGQWLQETMDGVEPMIVILERHKQAPKKAIQSLQLYAGTLQDMSNDLFDRVKEMPTDGRDSATARAGLQAATQTIEKHMKSGLTPPSSNTGGKGRKTAKTGKWETSSYVVPKRASVQAYADTNGIPPKGKK
jgi:hypothetical protein